MRTFDEMKAACDAHNARQNKNFLGELVDKITAEMKECDTRGCRLKHSRMNLDHD